MGFDTTPLKDRSSMHRAIRAYFDGCGYLEAETPLLVPSPIPESHIDLFRTRRHHPDGGETDLFLVPSPEVWLKGLLAEGAPSLYQIGRCFRNGEQLDTWHRLEFTMLEWYAVGATASDNIAVMQELLDVCAAAVRPGASAEVTERIAVISMEEAFREFAGFSLESDLRNAGLAQTHPADERYAESLAEAAEALEARLEERGFPTGGKGGAERETADDLFHRLFLTLVEDRLPADRPLVLSDWPALVPTLARRVPGTPWAERWELYIRGVETANCYGEENDPAALDAYWRSETERKVLAGAPAGAESNWPEKIAAGMPPCSGAAVGLDRLLALIRGDEGLEGLDLFPKNGMMRR